MPNVLEESKWEDGVRQVETGDPVAGGATGPVNLSLQDLANRTLYLKNLAESILADLNTVAGLIGNTGMDEVLLKASNLSDLPDKSASRTNLGVPAINHSHPEYLAAANNLSDISSPATGRQNLGVTDIFFASGAPAAETGKNGDIYIRTDLDYVSIYKKTAGAWALKIETTDISGNAATAALAEVATLAHACDGNAATASELKTARTINGINFTGGNNIVVPAHSAILKSESGYIVLYGSGLTIQWGRSPFVSADSYLDISFPIEFPHSCFICTGTIVDNYLHKTSEGAVTIGNITNTGFRSVNGADRGGPCAFVAIGY